MDKEKKERRRATLHDLREKERAQFIASLPAPKTDIRDLFEYLDSADGPCDHSLKQTLGFLRGRGLLEQEVVPWLQEHGGYCDCEVIFNVEDAWNQMVEEQWQQN